MKVTNRHVCNNCKTLLQGDFLHLDIGYNFMDDDHPNCSSIPIGWEIDLCDKCFEDIKNAYDIFWC